MIKLGLTGGIGSGKTLVATLFQLLNIPVYIADEESKRLTDLSPVIREKLIALFGKELYTEGKLNKPLLASLIFCNKENLTKVNTIIHPEVLSHFIEWTKRQTSEICVIESAILFESGFDKKVDKVLMVYAPMDIRVNRVLQRDNTQTREAITHRIESQLPDEVKKERADFIIYNDDKTAILPQLEKLLLSL